MPKIMKNGIEYGGDWETFSESETKIGTFLGKDLYRKIWKTNFVLPKTTASPNYYNFTTAGAPPDGYVTKLDAIFWNSGKLLGTGESSPLVRMIWTAATNAITLYRKEDVTSADIYCKAIIAEYTKETWS